MDPNQDVSMLTSVLQNPLYRGAAWKCIWSLNISHLSGQRLYTF